MKVFEILHKALLETKTGVAHLWLTQNNKALNLPYHNTKHCEFIACFAYMAAKYSSLSQFETRCLVLAGLFHDFNHLGAKALDDSENIDIALKGFNKYAVYVSEKDDVVALVNSLISATRFPYDRQASSELEYILRDADMLQIIEEDFGVEFVVEGLFAEMRAKNKELTQEQYLARSKDFYASVSLCSQYGKSLEISFREKVNCLF